ncbi:hypothetical protein DNK59_16995 [Pseudomonas sp. TKO26]|uniref:hypothetical protein n=1 Tax=unclassified Pseudomonas TaxID=196821 RepID=UPI000D9362BE|nr:MULTISPECIES: hypothetical protein [unclassified Pseudomonas]PYY84933.1 hypothetical protein DNK62_16995 [Pseudomonas sp. TKO30]PYY86841.1 hypothetical protein DNK61_16990 [Pseudomonas sp. TKO29]PYY89484.1 hypothetical protein DNK59_16995 [Pseudomonas sp. TKO26]PYY99313.1 hypothetical protein DNK60_16985 [Pseudomonas sp. TKO14]
MSSFARKALVLVFAAVAGFGALNALAAGKSTAKQATGEKVSMLGGKLTFTLPKGFTASALPAGSEADGTAGASGTLYSNATTRTVVIAAQNSIPNAAQVKDNDSVFLDAAVSGFLSQQAAALPDFSKQSEKSMTLKGLGVRQIDSTATQGGGQTLNSTLIAGSGSRMAVVQVISRAADKAGHAALMKHILGQ